MKKFVSILILGLITIICLTGCGGPSESDQAAVNTIKDSIQAGLEKSDATYSSYDEYKDLLKEGVSLELENVNKINIKDIEDEELSKILSEYVTALNNKSEGIDYIFNDSGKFNKLYYETGKDVQVECINNLMENYGLKIDEDYQEKFETFINAKKIKHYGLGEKITLDTESGKVAVVINGYVFRKNAGGDPEGDLLCEIENISYNSDLNPGYVETETFIAVVDEKGFNITQSGESYGETIEGHPCETGYIDMSEGQKIKAAITYQQPESSKMVKVMLGDKNSFYECYVVVK